MGSCMLCWKPCKFAKKCLGYERRKKISFLTKKKIEPRGPLIVTKQMVKQK